MDQLQVLQGRMISALKNRRSFLYIIFIAMPLFFIIDLYYSSASIRPFYLLLAILGGFAFRKMSVHFIYSGIVTLARYLSAGMNFEQYESLFGFLWAAYFLGSLSISLLIKNFVEARESLLQITTAMAKALDTRDSNTANHSTNVAKYGVQIAKQLGLRTQACEHIYIGGLLHDIGKIGVKESILTKPGPLTQEEFEQIKKHPELGYRILKHIPSFRQNKVLDMVLYHHERLDGTGYPKGLRGEEIPLEVRILSVADAYDAMTEKRGYRRAMSMEEAVVQLKQHSGSQFDPEVVEAFLKGLQK